ncbi:MAG: hypothetical protein R6U29_05500 [Desulfosudaceae bacterium]
MVRLSLLVKTAALLLVVLAAAGAADAQARWGEEPEIFVPETRYSFEPVPEGTEVSHDFVIQNKGDAPLEINRVKSG